MSLSIKPRDLWFPRAVTLLRGPAILALAFGALNQVIDLDGLPNWLVATGDWAAIWYCIGLASHCFDGLIVNQMGYELETEGNLWHLLDTVVFSLGLQLAMLANLVAVYTSGSGELVGWIAIVLYVAITALIESKYVEPRKNAGEAYYPAVYFWSGAVWVGLLAAISWHAGWFEEFWMAVAVMVYPAALFIMSISLNQTVHARNFLEYMGDQQDALFDYAVPDRKSKNSM